MKNKVVQNYDRDGTHEQSFHNGCHGTSCITASDRGESSSECGASGKKRRHDMQFVVKGNIPTHL